MTKDEKRHKEKLADMGCALCANLFWHLESGPVELHHLRSGGWGKGSYKTLIPLCVEHHRGNTGIHGMGTKAFERHYGITQQQLLDWALERIE